MPENTPTQAKTPPGASQRGQGEASNGNMIPSPAGGVNPETATAGSVATMHRDVPTASPRTTDDSAEAASRWPEWAVEDLAKSGLSPADAETLGMKPVGPSDYRRLLGRSAATCKGWPEGYWIPFPSPTGDAFLKRPDGEPYGRVRFRSKRPGGGKYDSPAKSGLRCYVLPQVHAEYVENTAVPVGLTEGEKKAICATRHGVPTIGLTGIWGWLASKDDREDGEDRLNPDLLRYLTPGREVLLIFDSDATETRRKATDFARCAMRLSKRLAEKSCILYRVDLPQLPQVAGRVGLDDYLMSGQNTADLTDYIAQARVKVQPHIPAVSADALAQMTFPEPRWAIPGLVPEGLALVAGKSKTGKSFLCLDLCRAVAFGGYALGKVRVEQGQVLYLALEDSLRRMQERLQMVSRDPSELGPDALSIHCELPYSDANRNLGEIADWLRYNPDARLVALDTLGRLKPVHKKDSQMYERETEFMARLQDLAQQHRVAILLVHHARKTPSDDPFDTVLGSTGLQGVADTTLVLTRNRGDGTAVLHVTGRDVHEQRLALEFRDGLWTLLGDAAEHELGETRKLIVQVLREAGEPLSPSEVAKALERNRVTVQRLMGTMHEQDQLWKAGKGKYTVPPSLTQYQ